VGLHNLDGILLREALPRVRMGLFRPIYRSFAYALEQLIELVVLWSACPIPGVVRIPPDALSLQENLRDRGLQASWLALRESSRLPTLSWSLARSTRACKRLIESLKRAKTIATWAKSMPMRVPKVGHGRLPRRASRSSSPVGPVEGSGMVGSAPLVHSAMSSRSFLVRSLSAAP